jgi:hypothetical protein
MPRNAITQRAGSLWEEITQNRVIFLSVLGSVSSVAALIITLLDKIALDKNLSPQLAAWRFILMLICLLCIGSTVIFSYHWAVTALYVHNWPIHKRIFWATIRVVVGFFGIGIFLDGLYAALYWNLWLYGAVQNLIQLIRALS